MWLKLKEKKKEGTETGGYIYIYNIIWFKKKMVGIPVLKAINLSIYISLSTNSFKKKKTLLKKIKHDPQDIFIIYNTS